MEKMNSNIIKKIKFEINQICGGTNFLSNKISSGPTRQHSSRLRRSWFYYCRFKKSLRTYAAGMTGMGKCGYESQLASSNEYRKFYFIQSVHPRANYNIIQILKFKNIINRESGNIMNNIIIISKLNLKYKLSN